LRDWQECAKLSSRQRLENLKYKIYLDLFNTFLVATWFHMCYIIVLSSVLFYNVENSPNKENLFEWVSVSKLLNVLYKSFQTFFCVCEAVCWGSVK
jgi:hypothetical protein